MSSDNSIHGVYSRTRLLLGEEKLSKLQSSKVLVVGLGGVGACVAEMLGRAGIGSLTLIDGDTIVESNMNRQIHSFHSTLGKPKVEAMKELLLGIRPDMEVKTKIEYISEESQVKELLQEKYDCVVDAIDTLTPKVLLLSNCVQQNLFVVSAMGAGGRLDPTKIKVDDISKSNYCKLAYQVRKKLHSLGIYSGIRVVYSVEQPPKTSLTLEEKVKGKKSTIGTISYMPNIIGCFCASEVVKGLI